jgi:serine/threonine-protein kinase
MFESDKFRSSGRLSKGSVVSHYRILGSLSRGYPEGFYIAHDVTSGKKVVLEFLSDDIARNPELHERFKRGIKRLFRLDHPNIQSTYAFEEASGREFVVLEYIEGLTLRQLMSAGELSLRGMMDIAVQTCRGLEEAHDNEIFHGGLNPDNIVIRSDAGVKIMGFGSPEIAGFSEYAMAEPTVELMAYMSPEQISGQAIDHRSDIFSFGILLYEMITGRLPFRADKPSDLAEAVKKTMPEPLSVCRPGLPDAFQRIISRCLEKNPAKRFYRVSDIMTGLNTAARSIPSSLETSKRKDPWNWVVIAAVIVLLAVAAYDYIPKIFPSYEKGEAKREIRLTIMPFENRSGSKYDFFADSLFRKLDSAYGESEQLHVIFQRDRTRPSDVRESTEGTRPEEIGDFVLHGLIEDLKPVRVGTHLNIRVKLVRTADSLVVWSETFYADETNIAGVQTDIALKTLEKLTTHTMPSHEKTQILFYSINRDVAVSI